MIQVAKRYQSTVLFGAVLIILGNSAQATDYPVAGTSPSQRLHSAPELSEYRKDQAWYDQALYGVSRPYPGSLRFLEDQGAWHTPFRHPGMLAPYDIRDWHQR